MIASEDRTAQVALYNYALGGVEGATGDVVIMHEAGPAGTEECNCATEAIITRDAVNHKTTYEIKLPAASLGLTAPLGVGTKFGLGMAINDGDELTPGQKGWGGLGAHALVFGKSPSETAEVTLGTTVTGGDLLFLSAINPGAASFSFRATDKGASIVDPASATLTIDGKAVTLTSKKTGDATDFTYTAATAFPPGSSHTYSLSVKDTLGNAVSDQGTFKTLLLKVGLNFGTDLPADTDPVGSSLLPDDVAGAPGVAQSHWNNLSGPGGDGTVVPVISDTGAGTSITVSWDSNNTWASTGVGEENNQFPVGPDRTMMTGYLDTGDATTSHVFLLGIPEALTAGNGYDVYVYALGGVPARGGGYRVVDTNGVVLKDYILATSPANPTSYVEVINSGTQPPGAGDFLIFKGLTAANITLEATSAPPQGSGSPARAPINGVQLVPSAPPPSFSVSITTTATGIQVTYEGTLESAATLAGPFTTVTGATSPYSTTPSGATIFYRSRK